MEVLQDYAGVAVRLTDERRQHILQHPEMAGMDAAIAETLLHPQRVVQSASDPQARQYYRFYFATLVGNKYLCVVVKITDVDAFVLTAYLTNKIKRGDRIWPSAT